MQGALVFTLDEANATLPEVIRITEETLARLQAIQEPWSRLSLKKFDALHGVAEEDLIRTVWARCMVELGLQPKGFFTVDFQSPEPDTLYCWTYGEDTVTHEHKTWETFVDRQLISNKNRSGDRPPRGHPAPPFDAP